MMYEEDIAILVTSLLTSIPSMALSIAAYVLSALAIYTIAKRRGLNKPWLAWIPVVNCWLLGSISDQYRYLVKGENKSKRKVLLVLNLLLFALTVAMVVVCCVLVAMVVMEEEAATISLAFAVLGLCLPIAGIAIAYGIIRYMALFDVLKSLDPDNAVLFLVLSILISVTEPFFLFFNRHKDLGMPPRKQPAYIPAQETLWQEQSAQEPWDREHKDYL